MFIARMLLLPIAALASLGWATVLPAKDLTPTFDLLSDEECWRLLPPTERNVKPPLPSWAKALVRFMPRTTAALLRVDYVHRAKSPIDPKLRAEMRFVAAQANGCEYSQTYAIADARRSGVSDAEINAIKSGDWSMHAPEQAAALDFAKKMTLASSKVTDDEFAALVKAYGEDGAAAMVILMAYSNFQDRLLICLGSPVEADGPLLPLDVTFMPGSVQNQMLTYPKSQTALGDTAAHDVVEDALDWASVPYEELQRRLEEQRKKPTRVRVPSWDEVLTRLPEDFTPPKNPVRIVWTRVCLGHQPILAAAWETLMRTAGAESRGKLDRVFSQGLFWVVTKTIDCPYCMGHCEMIWEVSGLSRSEIAQRSQILAGNNWSSFPPEEQKAFAFARKLTQSPAEVTYEDVQTIKNDYGVERGLNVLVYAARCNYMVRISNGFQLSLERENVFTDYFTPEPDAAQAPAAK